MSDYRLALRQVTERDQWPLWEWRSSDRIRLVSTNDEEIAKESHAEWFAAHFPLMRDLTVMVEWDGEAVGWFQVEDWDVVERVGQWGVSLGPQAAPPGLGGAMPLLALGHAFDRLGATRMWGQVLDLNTNMIAIMRRLGIPVENHLADHLVRLDGSVTGVTVYSVLADDWPGIRDPALTLLPGSMRSQVRAALDSVVAG